MAYQPESSIYDVGVFQWETTTPALGGVGGAANTPLLNLANRTAYLKAHIDALEAAASSNAGLNSPNFTGSPTAPTQALGDNSTKLATDAFVQNTAYSVVALNVAGNSNVNLTAIQAGGGVLKFTGALTGNISVIAPNAAKRWTVVNATTGNFTLTLKTAAGAGVAITQGKKTTLECDATDVYDPKTDFVDTVLAGNPTTTTQPAGDASTKVATTALAQQVRTGYGVVNVAGNVNVNLTQAQWGLPLLSLSGALTGNIAVVIPSASSQYLFQNSTTGGFVVTVRTAVGTGIDLTTAGGITQHLWCDGVDTHVVSGSFDTTYSLVRQPTITGPTAGQTISGTAPVVQGNAYYSLYGVIQGGAQFQVAAVGTFAAITWDSGTIGPVNYAQVPQGVLVANTSYYVRCRYQDNEGTWSPWSLGVQFNTGAQQITAPTITAPGNGATNVGDGTTLTSSAFAMTTGVDTQSQSDWEIWTGTGGTGTLVFSSYGDSNNLNSIAVPAGTFSTSTTYYPRVRYYGQVTGASAWSAAVSFTTASAFGAVNAGDVVGGGYFVGIIQVGGVNYKLIVSPLAGDANRSVATQANAGIAGSLSINDGKANTDALIAAGASKYPAAQYCRSLNIGGYTDWYLPSRDEIEMAYRALKPTTHTNSTAGRTGGGTMGVDTSSQPNGAAYTSGNPAQTAVTNFKAGGTDALTNSDGWYYSSTFVGVGNNQVWRQNWSDGTQEQQGATNSSHGIRAFRRIPV
jgi:hypothetical protein